MGFWVGRFTIFLGLAFFGATAPGIIANSHYSQVFNDQGNVDSAGKNRILTTTMALALIIVLGVIGWERYKLPRMSSAVAASRTSRTQGTTFFGDSTDTSIGSGQFNNHHGDVKTNVNMINCHIFNPHTSPFANSQEMPLAPSPSGTFSPEGIRNPESVGSSPIDTTSSSSQERRRHQGTRPQIIASIRPVQRSNQIYESELMLKGRGYPLWIPQPSLRLPIPYRTKGICIGDVGIITPYGGFDFLFNVCVPHDDPINPSVMPDGFVPIQPPLEPMDVTEFAEFASGSFLASSSVAARYNESPASGLNFESSGVEGAILTMPDGAYHEELGNVCGFRNYMAAHAKSWYKFANGPRGREAKNGDVHLVVGCDKTTKWGMAVFANHSQQNLQLKFRAPEQRRMNSGSAHFWEDPGIADVRVGPSGGENDELGATPQRPLQNQCLFVRTLNVTLADNVWRQLDLSLLAVREQKMSDDDHKARSANTSRSHPSAGRSSSNSSAHTQSDCSGHQASDGGPAVGQEDSPASDSVTILNFTPAPYTQHPSKILNKFLLLQKPEAIMAITHDKDWYSLLNDQDTEFPNPSMLVERLQMRNDVCEDNGIVHVHPKGRDQQSIAKERKEASDFGLSLAIDVGNLSTLIRRYLFGHVNGPNQPQVLETIETLTSHLSSKPHHSTKHELPASLPGHPDRLLILDDLLNLFRGGFVYEDMQEESIPRLLQQLQSSVTNDSSQARIQHILRLGNALQRRYSRLNLVGDLEDAIYYFTRAESLSLPTHYRHLEAKLGLATSIFQWYQAKGTFEVLITLQKTLDEEQEFNVETMLQPFFDEVAGIINSIVVRNLIVPVSYSEPSGYAAPPQIDRSLPFEGDRVSDSRVSSVPNPDTHERVGSPPISSAQGWRLPASRLDNAGQSIAKGSGKRNLGAKFLNASNTFKSEPKAKKSLAPGSGELGPVALSKYQVTKDTEPSNDYQPHMLVSSESGAVFIQAKQESSLRYKPLSHVLAPVRVSDPPKPRQTEGKPQGVREEKRGAKDQLI